MTNSTLTGWKRSERGAAAVEFALVLPMLLLVIGGAIEFGRAFWFYDTLSKATRDAARYLTMVHCSAGESASDCHDRLEDVVDLAKRMVTNAAAQARLPSGFTAGNVTVYCGGSICADDMGVPAGTPPAYVTVTVDYAIRLGEWLPLGYLGEPVGYNLSIQPHTIMRYMGG